MAYNTRKPPIDAAMLRLRKVSHQDEPTRLSIFDSKGEMDFWCLRDYCQDLALRGTKWECNKLASGPVRELPVFEVTDSEPIHEANAAAAEKEVNDVQKALSALSLLSPRIKPQPKRPSAGKPKASGGGGKKPSPKPKSKSKIMELEELLEMSQSSGSAALAVDSEEEESEAETSKPCCNSGIPARERQQLQLHACSCCSPSASGAGCRKARAKSWSDNKEEKSGPGDLPCVPDRAHCEPWCACGVWGCLRPTSQSRSFADASLYSQLILGFGSDLREAEPILLAQLRPCKKAIRQGSLTDKECLLRLKRWLVAGLNDADWPERLSYLHGWPTADPFWAWSQPAGSGRHSRPWPPLACKENQRRVTTQNP